MLDPVFAVELEPGRYVRDLNSADSMVFLVWTDRSEVDGELTMWSDYPNARVVRFKLEEVRDDENG